MTAENPIVPKPMIVGKPTLVVVDIQKSGFMPRPATSRLAFMGDHIERNYRAKTVIDAARKAGIPIIFVQEAHRDNLIDFGRELDGSESIHCLESSPGTPFPIEELEMRPDDLKITKRRYSVFYGTEMEILLKAVKAETLFFVGGFTDVCVHYSFADAHQGDYYCRVIEDCVSGSSEAAHDASLIAMEYLQAGARRQAQEVIDAFAQYAGGR
ncbi:isochorismatase family cysteine hydrolase [Ciceribacter sp. L1K22]|uniref:cysteine hydrolase family protein n=1 Tax=Ciceribacter sp. L1K22 TaxID=2820275 RepID=UPI001ABDFE6C|nr:isochorismatase family cysteine hydrolase [Ciceribacter sp. L1K22]MBO3761490.1 cysteine hydrolase [Ciceribacter sp. L1K22]